MFHLLGCRSRGIILPAPTSGCELYAAAFWIPRPRRFFFFKFRFSTYLAMLFHVISCKFHFFYQGTKREVFQAEEQGMHLWAYMKKTSLSSGGHLQITEGQWYVSSPWVFFAIAKSFSWGWAESDLAVPWLFRESLVAGGGGKSPGFLPFGPSPLSSLLRHLHHAAHGAHPLVTASGWYRGESPGNYLGFSPSC